MSGTRRRWRRGKPRAGVHDEVEQLLWQWGNEAGPRWHIDNRVGWPTECTLAAFIEEGPHAAGQRGAPAPSMSDQSLAVEKAVAAVTDPKARRALRYWNLISPIRGNNTLCARKAGVSSRTFRLHLKLGIEEVARILGMTA